MAGYPVGEAYAEGLVDVGDGHRVWWCESGNPRGVPALVLHGGPGSGSNPSWRTVFDPARYRIVQFDQRGCGRSTPSAADVVDLSTNTTAHLVADVELLREHLRIGRWLVRGASWGVTLALAYAQAHPERVRAMVLSAVATTTPGEVEWVTREVGRVFPREWEEFRDGVPPRDRDGNLAAAYGRLLHSPDAAVREAAARSWCAWEDVHVSLVPGYRPDPRYRDPVFRLVFARLVTHYWANAAFLGERELLDGMHRLAGVPGVLVHGRLDVSSPLRTAWDLHRAWPGSELVVVDGGHGGGGFAAPIGRALDGFADG